VASLHPPFLIGEAKFRPKDFFFENELILEVLIARSEKKRIARFLYLVIRVQAKGKKV
jgi:hypothetical protein